MEPGELVEFAVSDGHRLGVVTGAMGKKLTVRAEEGAEMRPSPKDITFVFGGERRVDTASVKLMDEALLRARAAIEEVASQLDLELTWEMVSELGEAMRLEELCDLIFGSQTPMQRLALLRALRADGTYFKNKREVWEARPVELIAQLRAQREAAERKQRDLDNFIHLIATAQALPEAERAAFVRQRAAEDDAFRDRVVFIQDFAASGERFERQELADGLLDEMESRGLKMYGTQSYRAFNLMVELGIWTRHENVWLHRYRISASPAPHLVEEAERLVAAGWTPEPWRRDLSDRMCASIDDASTRDIDDALSCYPREEGGWEVCVHIADPSAYVKPGSVLDEAARSQATSIYLPTGVVPMFPRELSEGAMSLVAGELRPAMTTRVVFGEALDIEEVEVFCSTVRVTHRLSYDEVDAMLEREARLPIEGVMRDLAFLTSELAQRRQDQGAVSFDIPEVKLKVVGLEDGAGEPVVEAEPVGSGSPSRELVAECMIMASANMAEYSFRQRIPVIYRSQEAPDGELFDEDVMAAPEGLARFFAMRRKMKPGGITTHPERHFGLGLDMYVQATSPIRRYSDLICQRQVKAYLAGEELPYSAEEILEVTADVESASREASDADRSTRLYWTHYYLNQRRGEELEATVLDWRDDRTAFVFVHAVGMRLKCAMSRKVPIGEVVRVVVDRADARREQLRMRDVAV